MNPKKSHPDPHESKIRLSRSPGRKRLQRPEFPLGNPLPPGEPGAESNAGAVQSPYRQIEHRYAEQLVVKRRRSLAVQPSIQNEYAGAVCRAEDRLSEILAGRRGRIGHQEMQPQENGRMDVEVDEMVHASGTGVDDVEQKKHGRRGQGDQSHREQALHDEPEQENFDIDIRRIIESRRNLRAPGDRRIVRCDQDNRRQEKGKSGGIEDVSEYGRRVSISGIPCRTR